MKHYAVAAMAVVSFATISAAQAQAPAVTFPNLFRDYRGQNDVNVLPGDRIQGGGQVSGGSANTTIRLKFVSSVSPSQNFTSNASNCGPLTVNANFCAKSVAN